MSDPSTFAQLFDADSLEFFYATAANTSEWYVGMQTGLCIPFSNEVVIEIIRINRSGEVPIFYVRRV